MSGWGLGREVTLCRGEVTLVESLSGGGKSSLCGFIYGNRRDYRGEIRFDDRDIRELKQGEWCSVRRSQLAMMMQDLRLFGELTAIENVVLKAQLGGAKPAREMFERLGIGDKINEPVGRLSFGQQQRVAFIRTLAQRADFFILDEPVSHLDDENGRVMAEMLAERLKETGAGAIVTSIGKRLPVRYDKTLTL